jgi:hypothetical protein
MTIRPRVIQIEAVYEQFASNLYARWPGLDALSFETQIRTILDSGWSGGQNVVPYLNPSRWERFYLLPKLVAPQLAWARQAAVPQAKWNLREILCQQIKAIEPDVIYLSDLGSFDFSILDELNQRPLMVAWLATRLPPGIPWSRIDLLLSGIGAIREEALRLGVRKVQDFNSAAPSFRGLTPGFSPTNNASPGVVFSGSFLGGYHDDRAKLLARLAVERPQIPVDVYTGQPFQLPKACPLRFHAPVFAAEVVETYANHAMVVDARAEFGLKETRFNRDTSNMRIFEATRAGALLLTEYAHNLESMFEIGSEIICYRSEEELIDLVSFYSNKKHVEARLRIAQKGFKRVLKSHTIEHRAVDFESILNDTL